MFGVARPTLTGISPYAFTTHGYFISIASEPQPYCCMPHTGVVKPTGKGPVLALNAVVEVILDFQNLTLGFTYNGVAQQSYTNLILEPLCLAVLFGTNGAVRLVSRGDPVPPSR